MNVRKFWRDLIYDTTANKIGSKKFMSIVSFFCILVLIFGNAWFGATLSLPALGAFMAMAGFNSWLGQQEKKAVINKGMADKFIEESKGPSEPVEF